MNLFMAGMYMAAGPLTTAKTWVFEQAQAGVAIVGVGVMVYLLAKRKISDMIGWMVMLLLVGVVVFSFDTTQQWLITLGKSIFGIA